MSNNTELNNNLLDEIIDLINSQNTKKLLTVIHSLHFADIAEIIENLSVKNAQNLFKLIHEDQTSASVLAELQDDTRKKIIETLSSKEIAENIINKLASDDAVDVLNELSDDKRKEVLSFLQNKDDVKKIQDLLLYSRDSAGGLMAKELIKVNENWSILQCLKEMRKQAESVKNVYTIYVVNDDNILLGSMSLRKLLITKKNTSIKDIINKNIISVKPSDTNESVANLMQKYNLVAIPVVDRKLRLIGRITVDDVMDIVKEEAEKDYQMASGLIEDIELNDSILENTRARIPWLIIGVFGGLFGAKLIDLFDLSSSNIELAFFIPLIAAMGGNVGVQSAAIVVQGLANETLKTKSITSKLLKEIKVSLINGIICSMIILCSTLLIGYSSQLSITVSISLLAVIIFAAFFGTFVPLVLNKYRIDPALATGPFITTINDIFGLLIYFFIGLAIL
tara:strand:- start:3082 stop:4437 length:1356 start_codon:yes stop_codon:yes gene_type:complete